MDDEVEVYEPLPLGMHIGFATLLTVLVTMIGVLISFGLQAPDAIEGIVAVICIFGIPTLYTFWVVFSREEQKKQESS